MRMKLPITKRCIGPVVAVMKLKSSSVMLKASCAVRPEMVAIASPREIQRILRASPALV